MLRYQKDAPIWNALAIPAGVVAVAAVSCSFCGVEVNENTLTRGTGKPRKILTSETIITPEGETALIDKIIHVQENVIACPDCVLKIKPIYARCRFCKPAAQQDTKDPKCKFCNGTRDGERLSGGIKFRETPG